MADSYPEPALLKGTNPEECELFVATVRRRAFAQGKQRDNEWIALFASGYFIGDALYWYEGLEESTQNDWSRLRPALLARFGRTGPPSMASLSVPTSAPAAAIPTPAAAPPAAGPQPLVRKGRLRILHANGSVRGYLAKRAEDGGVHRPISTDPDDALYVSFTTPSTEKIFEIEIIDTPQLPRARDILGVVWPHLSGDFWLYDINYTASCCSYSTTSSEKSWAVQRSVWKVSQDGELSVEYPKPDGGTESLLPSEHQSSRSVWWIKSSRTDMRGLSSVKVVLEDAT